MRIITQMKQGEYITNRLLPQFVAAAAYKHGYAFHSYSDNWVLRLSHGRDVRWIFGYQFDLNSAAVSAVVQDKVATHLVLKYALIPSVPHILVRSAAAEPVSIKNLEHQFSNEFVLKPLDGSGGRGVQIVADATTAVRTIDASNDTAWAASPLLQIEAEYRVIVLDNEVLISYAKTDPIVRGGLKLYNLGLGAKATDITDDELPSEIVALAKRACGALQLRLTSVDIVRLDSGKLAVLEINDGIMMENYARQSELNKKRAIQIYDTIVQKLFT